MKINDIFQNTDRTILSFEVFPPKKDSPIESVYDKLDGIAAQKPDFISVTYGAGGAGAKNRTGMIAARIQNNYGIPAMAHLTCVGNTEETAEAQLREFREMGIENVLALRGDRVSGMEIETDFLHASDLASFISNQPKLGFDIAGACYPEVHPESDNEVEDILNLKCKVDAGVSHLVSQLFFDNDSFYSFRERCQLAGINVPIEAGIMPVTNKKQIERMVTMCGAGLPAKFSRMMMKYEDKPEALRDAGIAYAINQIIDLISSGVDGIHLYTMNNPYVAEKITSAVRNLL